MSVLIWIVLAYVFFKSLQLVLRSLGFLSEPSSSEDEYYEPTNQTTVNITISDSFNDHSSYSNYKGGDHYGSSNKEKESTSTNPYTEGTSLYDIWKDINGGGKQTRSDRYR